MKAVSDKWVSACRSMFVHSTNPTQEEVVNWWLNTESRFLLILGGERGGKSWLAALIALMTTNIGEKGEYWIVGPDYLQARPEFIYMYDALKSRGLVDDTTVSMPVSIASPWSFTTIFGQTFRTKSSSDITKLASFSVSGIIMSEAAQQVYEVFLKLMGRVAETNGFLILSGTLERGLPWLGDQYKRWQGVNTLGARSFSLPSWSNTFIYPGGENDPRILELKATYPEDLFMERFAALPRKQLGLVLPEYDPAVHVKHLEYTPGVPVELWMDPGQHCYPVLFVQCVGLYTYVLDAFYARNQIVQDIIPQVMANKLWKYVDPGNAGVIDNAGKQHQANKSQIELWHEIAGVSLRANYVKLDTTINTLRFRLSSNNPQHEPLLYFNDHFTNARDPEGKALDVLAEPELWRWPDRNVDRNKPITPIDQNNDAMKAIGYGLVERFGGYVSRPMQRRGHRRAYLI